ncbi:hypothetical protein [Winogradskya consettensis]|nr:hypothetical protein [Actinoplanes consettensis]
MKSRGVPASADSRSDALVDRPAQDGDLVVPANAAQAHEALAPLRDQVVIATKFGWRIEGGKSVGLDSRPTVNVPQVAA